MEEERREADRRDMACSSMEGRRIIENRRRANLSVKNDRLERSASAG